MVYYNTVLLRQKASRGVEDALVQLAQYMDVLLHLVEVDWTLDCVSVRSSTFEEKDYSPTKDIPEGDFVELGDYHDEELLE